MFNTYTHKKKISLDINRDRDTCENFLHVTFPYHAKKKLFPFVSITPRSHCMIL